MDASAAMPPPAIPIPEVNDEQASQQATQPFSQMTGSEGGLDAVNDHLWGFLLPCSPLLNRIDFFKIQPSYLLGRGNEALVKLPGLKISNKHCTIRWDGSTAGTPVVVQDHSSNGTFINGKKIGKGQNMLLKNGNEIAFGTDQPQPNGGGIEDYRFVFRFTAAGPAQDGLWAHYEVSHELGTGSFATVHKALSRKTGEWVAVKMIRSSKLASPNGKDSGGHSVNANILSRATSFAREIKILQDLKHPNICTLIETFWTETEITLVLELIEGGDLLDYILKNDGVDEYHSRFITYQLCDALAYIHGQGVAHRDLKPENVLLTKHDPPIVKVADFGLAKYIDSLTMLKTMCGTPAYLAPEVVQQNEHGYGNIVDSWSVGVIVFSMLTVTSPFNEKEETDVKRRIESRTTDWSLLTGKGFSAEVKNFIRRLLDESPKTRMTAVTALKHPWLAGTAVELRQIRNAVPNNPPAPTAPRYNIVVDASMAEESLLSMGSDFGPENNPDVDMAAVSTPTPTPGMPQDMSLDHNGVDASGAYSQVTSASQNPIYRMPGAFPRNRPSGRVGLQRRSRVIADAQANGHRLPEPCPEMLAHAAAESQPSSNPESGSNPLKRKIEPATSLTPLSEGIDDASMAGSSDHEQVPPSTRKSKRGRKSPEPQTSYQRGGSRRFVATGKTTKRKQRGAVDSIREDDEALQGPQAVRRSPRTANAGSRR